MKDKEVKIIVFDAAYESEKSVLFKDLPEYECNPFIEPILSMKMKKKTVSISSSPQMTINEYGQYIGDSYMIVKRNVDKEEFVKVFKNQLKLIFDLTKTAQKVLGYFIENLGMNKDFVIFDRTKAKISSSLYSDSSIYQGLSELIQKSVIAKSKLSQIYFINPAILFNGDRLIVINAWIKDDNIIPPSSLLLQENWTKKEQTK
jgi:hypothetical protein